MRYAYTMTPSPKPEDSNTDGCKNNINGLNCQRGCRSFLESSGSGFHSPITTSIKIDTNEIPGIPEFSHATSLMLEPRLDTDLLERIVEHSFHTNEDLDDDDDDDDDDDHRNLCGERNFLDQHPPSQEKSTSANEPFSDEDTVNVPSVKEFMEDIHFHDADFIQRALSIVMDQDEEQVKPVIAPHNNINTSHSKTIDQTHHNQSPDSPARVSSPLNLVSESAYEKDCQICVCTKKCNRHCNRNEGRMDNSDYSGTSAMAIEQDRKLLPRVTFDDDEEIEEVFDRRTFFDAVTPKEYQPPSVEPLTVLTHSQYHRPRYKPSRWLQDQMASEKMFSSLLFHPLPLAKKTHKSPSKTIRASEVTKHKHWSEEEDENLRLAMNLEQSVKPINWVKIAHRYFSNTRSATQCKNRWKNYLKPGVIRGNWQKHEDDRIRNMVAQGYKWVEIANCLPGRIGEHVRERYVNFLDVNLKKTSWTPEEDKILFDSQRLLGNKWCEIRKLLPGRSDNSIKNRFHNRKNAQKRKFKREQQQLAYADSHHSQTEAV